jgi:predicted transcriptional regulator
MEYKKNEKNLLSVRFLIRMTEQEKETLVKKARDFKISQAEFLRKSLMTLEDENHINPNQKKSILSRVEYNLLLNIANNLNQNTKFANTNKILHDNLDEAINRVMTFIELKS